jgi:hypothetical protein
MATFYTLPADYLARARRVRTDGASVIMPNGSNYTVRNLLTEESANLKLSKSGLMGTFYTVGLTLSPANLAGMGNLCPNASPACLAGCLNTAGKGLMLNAAGVATVQMARIAKTRFALSRDMDVRADFISALVEQLERAETKARKNGKRLAVRLNVLSDLAWEKLAPWLFERFSTVQFYDYTKNRNRIGSTPANYDLTFSRSETNETEALNVLASGGRVAVVFSHKAGLPTTWFGYPVVDADEHDMRFLDGNGVVSGLKAKGQLKRIGHDAKGFVITDDIARAASADAANRGMRADGRKVWSLSDYNLAARTFGLLMPQV